MDQSLTEPVCTGLHKFLIGWIFYLCKPFTRTDRTNFVTDCSTVCGSKTCTVPRVPCKRKANLCKFLSVQKFVRTLVNGATVTLSKINSFDLFLTIYNHQAGFLKTSAETISKSCQSWKKKNWAKSAVIAFFLLVLSSSLLSLFLLS